jgi:hypothetical protein
VSSTLLLSSLLAACLQAQPTPSGDEAPTPESLAPVGPDGFEPAPAESARLPLATGALEAAAVAAQTPARLAVTLDRPLYRPGETVWARVWDLEAGTLAGSPKRPEVVVSLVDARGSVQVQQRYANTGAGATAAVDVPVAAAGGVYRLRVAVGGRVLERPFVVASFEEPRIRKELDLLRDAYAPGDEVTAAFTVASSGRGPLVDHPLQVLVQVDGQALPAIATRTDTRGEATLRFTLPDHIRRPDAVLTVVVEEDGWTESISREIPVVLAQLQVELFPEGGDLVAGLPGRVYLRVRDQAGQAADARGVVVDERGAEVASFDTVHDGLGRFDLTPRRGARYTARVTSPVVTEVELPAAKDDGCVLRTYDDLDGTRPELRAGVWCSTRRTVTATGALRGKPFVPATLNAGPTEPAVAFLRPERPEDALAQGVATVTLLDDALLPLAERLVYRNRQRALSVTVEPQATRYGPRDEVVLKVTTRDPEGEPVAADLALSVADDRLVKYADDEHGNLLSALHLEPWLQGAPEDPAWYFDPAEPLAPRGLDLVVGTFGWRRFSPPPGARPDAGEGARAKREEGRVGKASRREAEAAGVLGAVGAELELGLGGLLGAEGTQLGAGGLGGRGVGIGGGGLAEGLGALGTKGMGSGASGFGSGGGRFGAKGEGGIGAIGGDPIILGALERPLIDAVVKRHLNQIRYCYQRELTRNPVLAGRIVEKFTIARDGTVAAAQTKSTTMHNASVESCITGRFLRMQFPEPRGGGIVIVSYPLVFSPNGRPEELEGLGQTPVRQFAQPDYSVDHTPSVRTDFRSTVAWVPSVQTAADGTATVRFFLADPVTTYRVTAEGVGGGHVGHVERELHSTLPFSLDAPLPTEVSFGDRLLVPVRVSNRRPDATDVVLHTRVGAPLVADDGMENQVLHLGADAGTVTVVPITVPDLIGSATLDFDATSGGLSDAVHRTLLVAPRGFPHRWTAGGDLDATATHAVSIDQALSGGTEGKLVLYPSPTSSLLAGAASMVRIPNGCFEQTSSTNHPNVLVLEYLDRTGGGGGLLVDRTQVLRAGYQRLVGYQVAAGGFETFGQGPGKEALSAYGLLQFTRMRTVFPEVEPAMMDRDVAFLLAARDGAGGYRNSGVSSHSYGLAPQELNDAYITRALVETGHLGHGPEVERQRAVARTTTDPYRLALATLTLAHLRDPEAGEAAARLASLQAADGSFPGAATSVERSGGQDLLVETTGLASLALTRSGGNPGVALASRWLGAARQGSWGWGGTQATVLALEALTAEVAAQPTSGGTVRVSVDGRVAQVVEYTGTEREAVTVDLSRWLTPGPHQVSLTHDGERPVPYTVEATWRRDTPADAPNAPLRVATTLASDTVALGHTVRLTATLENTTDAIVASPLARIGLPAGVHVEQKALEALRDQGRIAAFETRPREITLYWQGMAPNDRQDYVFDLVADVPGTFTAPPTEVYPYYDTQAKRWAEGDTLRITP